MHARSLGLCVSLVTALSLAPRSARAQGAGAPDLSGYGAIVITSAVIGGGVVIGGVVADAMVSHDLIAGQGVRRGPAIAGTTLWGISAAVTLPLSIAMLSNNPDPAMVVGVLLSDAVVFGSLALSIYGLTRPPPTTAPVAPWAQRIVLHPTVIATQHGIAPGAGLTLSL